MPVRGRKKALQWNEPPMAGDEQGASWSMGDFIEAKNKRKKPRRKKKNIIVHNEIIDKMEDQGAEVSSQRILRQKCGESCGQFLGRLQRMGEAAIAEAKMAEKYDVEVVSLDKIGNATYRPAPDPIHEPPPINNTREKRKRYKEKLQEKKKRLKTHGKEFDLKKENIPFGEVAHAPPTLKAKPRKAPALNKVRSMTKVLER